MRLPVPCSRLRLMPGGSMLLAAVLVVGLAACGPQASRVAQAPDQPAASPSDRRVAQAPTELRAEATVRWREFSAEVHEIDAATRERMAASWRPGCPVGLEALRLLALDHWGFDGTVHRGELVVHADWAPGMVEVFRALFQARYPIERLRLVDEYGGDDDASMAANNSSGFNCREIAGRPGVWSEHAYGRAVDLNPVQNPYVARDGAVSPPAGAEYADRTAAHPAVIRSGDAVVSAFAGIGWPWGGDWSGAKDYQHFSSTGR